MEAFNSRVIFLGEKKMNSRLSESELKILEKAERYLETLKSQISQCKAGKIKFGDLDPRITKMHWN